MNQNDLLLLQRRRAAFPDFIAESKLVLNDFLNSIRLPPADSLGFDYRTCIDSVGGWLGPQVIPGDGRAWLITSMTYLFGEYFISVHGGKWMLNEIEGSTFFGIYVIGQFPLVNRASSMVDPRAMATDYVDAPPGRDIKVLLKMAESALGSNRN